MSRYEKAAQLKSPHPVRFWKRHSYRDSKEVAGCQGFMGRGNQAEHGGFRAAGGLCVLMWWTRARPQEHCRVPPVNTE